MSLPRYKITVLALSLGVASAFVGCSSNPSKKDVVDKGPQSSEQVYFEKAIKSLERNQYTDAVKSLEALDTYYPTGQYTQQAQLELLYAKFKQKDYEGTIALADRFIRLNPQHPNVDYAYYVRGVANMEMNYDSLIRYTSLQQSHRDVSYVKVAYQNFVELIRRFPSSQYSVDAAQRMKFIGQELAESEMNAARFNIERKAWLAAAERAQWVIEHYPQTPQTPEALATLGTRLAAVYRSEYLDSIGKGRAFDIYVAPNTQLDFSLDYKFTPRVSMYFEAQNLLDKPLELYQGTRSRTLQMEEYGRTYALGLKVAL